MPTPARTVAYTPHSITPRVEAPAPATPAPAPAAPGRIFNTPINAYNWGDKMFGGAIKSMADFQGMFDKIYQIDPKLAYNFLEETNSWARNWVAQKYFGADPSRSPEALGGQLDPAWQKYNTWINMSSPVGSNAASLSPQEKYWMYKTINQGNSAWGTELDSWFRNAPGNYYGGINYDWAPQQSNIGNVYGGVYQDGQGGFTNPAQLAMIRNGELPNTPENAIARPLGNPYLQATAPNAGLKPNPAQTRGPGTAIPTPQVSVPGPSAGPGNAPSTPVVPNVATPTNPVGSPGGYQYRNRAGQVR
jgi:hypothetical protein